LKVTLLKFDRISFRYRVGRRGLLFMVLGRVIDSVEK